MFNIAIAGQLPEDEGLFRRLNEQVELVRAGLDGADEVRIAVCPDYACGAWRSWVSQSRCPAMGILRGEAGAWEGSFTRVLSVQSALREGAGEVVCDEADLLLAVWNEDAAELDGAVWELIHMALKRRLPCVWVSTRSGKIYWQEKTIYDTYAPERLGELARWVAQADVEPDACGEIHFPLLGLGQRLYRRFLAKYRAAASPIDAQKDVLLKDDFTLQGSGEAVRRGLLERYHRFDRAAIAFNERYQAVLYWRSILPFIASIFIALGFYGASVIAAIPIFSREFWIIAAGCGFLLHGLVNLYGYLLSRSPQVAALHDGRVRNRKMAEMLRVIIHFAPFGIRLDLRQLCGDDPALCASLRRIVRDAEAAGETARPAGREEAAEAFAHVSEMMQDQIDYHRRSEQRYAALVAHLDCWSRTVFYAGFIIVLLRAVLQFAMAIPGFPTPQWELGNGVKGQGFISSGANMLALLVPAWYSYFAEKLSLNNFQFNCSNHRRMLEKLTGELDNFEQLREVADAAPAEAMRTIAEGIADLIVRQDIAVWGEQYQNTRVKRL